MKTQVIFGSVRIFFNPAEDNISFNSTIDGGVGTALDFDQFEKLMEFYKKNYEDQSNDQ